MANNKETEHQSLSTLPYLFAQDAPKKEWHVVLTRTLLNNWGNQVGSMGLHCPSV